MPALGDLHMQDWSKLLAQEWVVISSAPISFIAAMLLVAFAIWAIVNWVYRARLERSHGEIKLLERQRDDYQGKLDGATPDEAKARIDKLEAQIEALSPRRLSDDQRLRLTATLRRLPGKVEICHDMASPDTRGFAGDLIVAFQKAGWHLETPAVLGPANPPPQGVGLAVPHQASMTPHQTLIAEGFNAIGLSFDLEKRNTTAIVDASLLITHKII